MKSFVLIYSLITYSFFLGIFTYLVLFLGGGFLKDWIPLLAHLKTVDDGATYLALDVLPIALGNLVLLLAFSVQHSVMSRKSVKNILTKVIPQGAERSTFVMMTCLVLGWMYLAWQPQPNVVWSVTGVFATLLAVLFLLGATLVLWSTFMISHWQLFGLAQAWHAFRNIAPQEDTFAEPALYKFSRHPMYLGILIVLWSSPHMTIGHLLLAVVWTFYVFIGIGYEERDLLTQFGKQYQDYMARVPKLLPVVRRRKLTNGIRLDSK